MNHAGGTAGTLLLVSALVLPLVLYGIAVLEAGPSWPAGRTVCWVAGLAVLGVGLVLPPLAVARPGFAGHGFVSHATGHLLVGMAAPLLLALARPVPLVLRALPVARARALVRVLRSVPARTLAHPATAAVLDVGGLWVLYTTGSAGHPLAHVHLVLAGYLFAAAVLGTHPRPAGFPLRAGALVVSLAAHGVLAKYLYAHAPDADHERGAVLMYYGGDVIDLVLITLLCRAWFGALSRRRSAAPATGPRSCGSPRAPRSPSCP